MLIACLFVLSAIPATGGVASDESLPRSIDDDFEDGTIDPLLWNVHSEAGVEQGSVTETNGRLIVDSPGGTASVGLDSQCWINGDFEVLVDFELLSWPSSNFQGLSLAALSESEGPLGPARIERRSQVDEVYSFVTPWALLQGVPTADLSGTLRMVREDSVLSGYFWQGGEFGALPGDQRTGASGTPFGLHVRGVEGSSPVTVAFDNFRVESGLIICYDIESFDSNLDGVADIDVRGLDQQGVGAFVPDGNWEVVQLDLNRDGFWNFGQEPNLNCPLSVPVTYEATPPQGANPLYLTVNHCDPFGSPTSTSFAIRDWNGDGDTADPGEVGTPGSADLSLEMTSETNPILFGEEAVFITSIRNNGGDAATGVWVTQDISSRMFGPLPPECSLTPDLSTAVCYLPDMAPGTEKHLQFVGTGGEGGAIWSSAIVGADTPDPNEFDNFDNETVVVTLPPTVDLSIDVWDEPDSVTTNLNVAYHIDVSNLGTGDANAVTVFATLDSGEVQSASGSDWTCDFGGPNFTCAHSGPLPPGADAADLLVVVKAPAIFDVGFQTFVTSSQEPDAAPENNSAIEITVVRPPDGTATGWVDDSDGAVIVSDIGLTDPTNSVSAQLVVGPGDGTGVYSLNEIGLGTAGAFYVTTPEGSSAVVVTVRCDESLCPRRLRHDTGIRIVDDLTGQTLTKCRARPGGNPTTPCAVSIVRDPVSRDLIYTVRITGNSIIVAYR